MKISGAQAIVNCLIEQGVEVIFGYPGGQVIPLYDALYDAPIKHVLTVHEQGAVHAADGYARASGKTGVCIATSGPGATNIVTGLATAYMDSVPLVAITGQVPTGQIGRDAFQEIDIVSITMATTKHNFSVQDVTTLPDILRQAFAIAKEGRPGPVLVDIPSDIQKALVDYAPMVVKIKEKRIVHAELDATITAAKRVIENAVRPVLLVGGGVIRAQACESVRLLAEKCHWPVVSTLMGLGVFPARHEQFLGMTGMHGLVPANKAINGADVIIAVGARFSDRVTGDRTQYAMEKKIIHIDIDPSEVDKNIGTCISLVGDVKEIVNALLNVVAEQQQVAWWQELEQWQTEFAFAYDIGELSAPWVMHYMNQKTQQEPVIFVTDVGQTQMWAAQHLKIDEPRHWLTSGGFGTMGFGLPAALGAQLAMPDKRVIHLAGDGGFKMTGMELDTVVNEALPIISIVVNNRSLGMVRQWQQLFFKGRYSATLLQNFDFATFAATWGIHASVVTTQEEFKQAFDEAFAVKKQAFIVVEIPAEHLVIPMIAPGATLDDYVEVG